MKGETSEIERDTDLREGETEGEEQNLFCVP